ncbi:MAG: hypothetical protein EOO80_16315 [Oxalobacteraceae bacterium]|nr:MAG: hypothetical protein EOO80_16315 [Oxalobacteraceae bacterium]
MALVEKIHGARRSAGGRHRRGLGQLQYQDVVRQCVERLQAAIAQRNAALGQECIGNPVPQPDVLARLVADITADYLATERLHGDGMTAENSAPAIELF